MSEVSIRSVLTESPSEVVKPSGKQEVSTETDVEVPYSAYKSEHGKSLISDYFELGTSESEFETEIENIENYFADKVKSGMSDSPTAVKEAIKKMEKMANIDKNERTTLRVAKLAAYVRFLSETQDIDKMIRRYE